MACGYIDNADIFIGWSSFCLHALRKAKAKGCLVVVQRVSSHIVYQQEILKEEYDRLGIEFNGESPQIIGKELKEYEEADYIQVASTFAKRTFLQLGTEEEKIIQIPLGVDPQEFNKGIPKEDNVFRIIYVGNMSLRKGVHYLLQAFSELNLPNSELWLIGKMDKEITPFLKKYDNGKVFCKGPFPQRELYKYYSQGSIFVLMSIEDGFGMVILQAMACGLPVISTINSGGPDVIREGIDGYIIPVRSVYMLKERIVYLYERPHLLKDFAENAKKRVKAGYTWDNFGEQCVEEYEKILKKR
jgi:glycosyltransferase involved in cell wall biosynthesis